MCLGIPGKVTETYREHDVLMGKVDFGGVFKPRLPGARGRCADRRVCHRARGLRALTD